MTSAPNSTYIDAAGMPLESTKTFALTPAKNRAAGGRIGVLSHEENTHAKLSVRSMETNTSFCGAMEIFMVVVKGAANSGISY